MLGSVIDVVQQGFISAGASWRIDRELALSHIYEHFQDMYLGCKPNAMRRRRMALLAASLMAALLADHKALAQDDPGHPRVGDIFVIALENHNFTQPDPASSPMQILGNSAAPFINSLITAGNPNAAQVSFATAYYNAGNGVHPSEPNYVWAEAGSDFGFHDDADPSPTNGNTFYDDSPQPISQLIANGFKLVFWHRNETPHLTGQLNAAGIPWKNYQEDLELSASPTISAAGTDGPVNRYNGTTQYHYAVKHNPMAFFSDSAFVNVYPLAQLFLDLDSNAVGRFNWITPDEYNEAHSALTDGFTYHGIHYTGDQSAMAAADNFLSIVVPVIMASRAYRDNGVIILNWDETEGGDTASFTLPEIIISPLAKGNAYAGKTPMSHSSDLKTIEEIFGLPFANNPIPADETNVEGGYNYVATANDLGDLFMPGTIPAPVNLSATADDFVRNRQTHLVSQKVRITNRADTPAPAPLFLVLDNLSTNATLLNSEGTTAILPPLGSPYVRVNIGEENALRHNQTATATLEFRNPSGDAITYETRVLDVTPAP
jgi:hypothetical protein